MVDRPKVESLSPEVSWLNDYPCSTSLTKFCSFSCWEQTSADLVAAINRFRRLHCSPGVLVSEKLNTLANKWATTIAALGEAKKDNSSTYGQLICKYSGEDSIVTACVSKWYSCITDFDWAEPKLSNLSSPFTQMVWKSNKQVGVGFAKGDGSEVYVVVLLEPGQNGTGKVRDNVLPATGKSAEERVKLA